MTERIETARRRRYFCVASPEKGCVASQGLGVWLNSAGTCWNRGRFAAGETVVPHSPPGALLMLSM
jgi:hypothetical protein